MVSAGILGQWPVGRLADRYGRLLVLRVQVFVVILGCLAMLSQAAMAPALVCAWGIWFHAVSGGDGLGL
ncbi:MFS-type transporter protein ycaD [Klebsiella pneumoniae subsp. ozaenae]|uniref:MFS-type transporter protein ycaD n=1 Tax=Klebsiella pneumoniae subsp. ozaenae TaxID=574 RepID=A0A378BNQ5_KLEPO|nr:MFS-type transporter protein ycaD [Klebsiella pneumoniae subsp. ozaenae]